jgi:hypothetical protein
MPFISVNVKVKRNKISVMGDITRYCAGVNGREGCLSDARASSNVDAIVPMVMSEASLLLRLEEVCSLLAVLIPALLFSC